VVSLREPHRPTDVVGGLAEATGTARHVTGRKGALNR
jgi:hypothetical protein